jgi:hypothetical protein
MLQVLHFCRNFAKLFLEMRDEVWKKSATEVMTFCTFWMKPTALVLASAIFFTVVCLTSLTRSSSSLVVHLFHGAAEGHS